MELNDAASRARELDPLILARINDKRSKGQLPDLREKFDSILSKHGAKVIANAAVLTTTGATNLFELVGASKLARANILSRLVSTHLGEAWEEMAALSHLAISPEVVFGERILGVDVVFLEDSVLRHTQIKTQKNTLTGSQKDRSVAELLLHPRPLFAAAFDVANWTFPPQSRSGIERVAGKGFWSKLDIDYQQVMSAAQDCILRLEAKLLA